MKKIYDSDICSIDDCNGLRMSKGWCEMHYARFRRHGDTDKLTINYDQLDNCLQCGCNLIGLMGASTRFCSRRCDARFRRNRSEDEKRVCLYPGCDEIIDALSRSDKRCCSRQHARKFRYLQVKADPIQGPRMLSGVHLRRTRLKNRGFFTAEEWRKCLDYYGNFCLKCNTTGILTVDHVVPISKGGMNTIDNLQPLCLPCNVRKNSRVIDYRFDGGAFLKDLIDCGQSIAP